MASFILTDTQEVAGSAAFTDKAGNPATVDGAPVWASSDETVLTAAAAADGMSGTFTATGKLGSAQGSVTADADLGSGIESVILTQDFDVVASKAVAGTITLGTPTEKP